MKAASERPPIRVEHVWKWFRLYHQRAHTLKETLLARRSKYEEFWALKDVSFDVGKGEMLGIIGPNGSGKSTLLKCMARIISPNSGEISVDGSMSSLLELGTGFHPELSGRENVYLAGSILGLAKSEIDGKLTQIVDFSGLGEFIDTPLKNYSSGMTARLAFSVAISIDPEILLLDEVLAVGDEEFQLKCFDYISGLRRSGKTIVFVSHSLSSIRRLCSKVLWLEKGVVRAYGDTDEVVSLYQGDVRRAQSQAAGVGASENRWGNQDIRIESFNILDGEGKEMSSISTGEYVVFRIAYESEVEAEGVVPTIRIHSAETGGCVAGINSLTNPEPRTFTISPGKGYLEFECPRLALWRGRYLVTVGLGDQLGSTTYDWREKAFEFGVIPGKFDQGDGAFYMDGTWGHEEI
jgi:lipopolysaccharide transport system ATP-binding protein